MDVRVKPEREAILLAEMEQLKSTLGSVPDNISGDVEDVSDLFYRRSIIKRNISHGLFTDPEASRKKFETLVQENRVLSRYFRARGTFATPFYGWKGHILPLLRNKEKSGDFALLIEALEKDFELKQGWLAWSKTGVHKPHRDNLTKGATHRIIFSLFVSGKTMTFEKR